MNTAEAMNCIQYHSNQNHQSSPIYYSPPPTIQQNVSFVSPSNQFGQIPIQFYSNFQNLSLPKKSIKLHPKAKFSPVEDQKLKDLVAQYGENWDLISKLMVNRNQRQCKERWSNYLAPTVRRDPWTEKEDELLKKLYEEIGAKWVKISSHFPNRTDTNIKNRWMVLQRQKRSKRSGNSMTEKVEIKSEVINVKKLNDDGVIVDVEDDSKIDFLDDISSVSPFDFDFNNLFDMSWI